MTNTLKSKTARFFQSKQFSTRQSIFQALEQGQTPTTLMITCSDSRVVPSLFTQSNPGEIFMIRNAGNIIPEEKLSGELATLEYAVSSLNIKNIIVCGHTHCGAMKALIEPDTTSSLPLVRGWVKQATPVLKRLENLSPISNKDKLTRAVEQNTLLQVERISRLPFVKDKLDNGLNVEAWVYHIGSGKVTTYDKQKNLFTTLERFENEKNTQSSRIQARL